jgi:molecular chaperone HtpG
MAKKQFKAESKRLLDLMINSIYTQKEIFLRELISNASDALDKLYYKTLTDENLVFDKDNFQIQLVTDKPNRLLTVKDTGIGMTKEELEANLGTIARSGSLAFKQEHEMQEDHTLIGQFGVGFYSSLMVAEQVTVRSRAFGSEEAWEWETRGADGYTIKSCDKADVGTEVILKIKPSTDEESFDEYLDPWRIKAIVKKYSDFIRYPIKLEEDGEWKVLNSMVPIWRKNKNELKDEDYENFYRDKRYGFDKPLKYVHIQADGAVVYRAILYIPERIPFDYYTKEYEKGLELYANGVLIMGKCGDLLPDHFSFVKGMVDSEDLSLNISREMLQHDRQLKLIAKNIAGKIKSTLLDMLKNERDKYETFYQSFGRQLKFGVYNDFGANKDVLQDLLMFVSSKEKKLVTLDEYVSRMPEDQKYIYYGTGDSPERIEKLPQAELVLDKGYELLYFTEDIDEFAIKMLMKYKDKEFRNISGGDLGIEADGDKKAEEEEKAHKALFEEMKRILGDKVKDVKASHRLKSHPVCLSAVGEVSIEMEKVLSAMPNNQGIRAEKVLEINVGHDVFKSLQAAYEQDKEKLARYTNLLYQQARLIEGLPVEDPVAFSNDICMMMV